MGENKSTQDKDGGKEKAELEDCKEKDTSSGQNSEELHDTTEPSSALTGHKEKVDKDEIVFVQETGFTVKVYVPGVEPFDIQVSSMELVQEIHQLLMDREDTCHRTCFSLQLDGNSLDNFAELKAIDGLKDGSVIRVVEEPYTVREARIHVRHVRDLLKSLETLDAYNGVDFASLSFLNSVTSGDAIDKKKGRPESVDCTPPEYIMPGCKERPILPLHPHTKEHKNLQCLKVLTTSGWNPPPGPRRLHGDLLYLYLVTAEEKRYHITACTKGFFVNQSTDEQFSPKPASPNYLCHALVDLLAQISAGFKRNFCALQKRRTTRHPFERVATPYQVYSWTAPALDHTIDAIRAEDAFSSKLGYEEHIPGQMRDWNEELQTTRELPRKTLPERLLRERAIFKVHSDFVSAATRGAVAVIDGNVMPINPGEEAKMQMFIWNNIFFSLGFDVRDHYKELGGDAAAFVAPKNDLQGVKVYSMVDSEGVYTLGTVVVDYRGYRVTAQSIIPGILERDQEQSVVYGSIDFGKTVVDNAKYVELLSKASQQLKIAPHRVLNHKDDEVQLCSSVECKGIVGNDGRHYILDLLRTFPPDVNFLSPEDSQLELSREARALGMPVLHRHRLACLRQELVDAFVENRYMAFIKYAARQLQSLTDKKQQQQQTQQTATLSAAACTARDTDNNPQQQQQQQDNQTAENDSSISSAGVASSTAVAVAAADEGQACDSNQIETNEAKKIVESITDSITSDTCDLEESTKEIVKRAAAAVGSLKEAEFEIRFNPDVFSPGVRHPSADTAALQHQRHLARDAADFLLTTQIPSFVRDCLDHSAAPLDGATLSEALHARGINIRYLGKVADMLAKVAQLGYLHRVCVGELLARAVKHVFTVYMQCVEMMCLSAAVAHFINCYLSSCCQPHPPLPAGELWSLSQKRKNRRRPRRPLTAQESTEWALLTPRSLWTQIRDELKAYYDWQLPTDSLDSTVAKFHLQKVSLFRVFCIKSGVQMLLRDYNMDLKNKPTFAENDVINIFPVSKHINPKATDAFNFYTTGQSKIQQGFLKEGHELISEALNLLNNVYGAMHPEIAQCVRMLARLNYIMGDHQEALQFQQKAVMMSERVNGIDHPYTIAEYMNLALYCFANGQVSMSLKLLYRSRYLMLLICGEQHPEVALLDSNIGLILHAVGEYNLSVQFLESALALCRRYHGARHLKTAMAHHLVARTQSCMGDFRAALQNEKETFAIYKIQLGEDHEKTRESSECLRHLTQQAVMLQKKMNDLYSGKMTAGLPPIQIQSPSMGSVLDMLNIINGILFVQISHQDIENFKAEVERRKSRQRNLVCPALSASSCATNSARHGITGSDSDDKENVNDQCPVVKSSGGDDDAEDVSMSFNSRMHPRNIYRNPPDFQQLLEHFPEIAPHMTTDLSGKLKFDFKSSSALRQLTQVLLKKDFNLLVHIPEDHLVPTLPSRLNYLLWMQDLLACLKLPPDVTISGLDIGTGACAIYCLLGATFGWHMVGTDNSETSVQCASSNVARNNLQHLITVTPAGQHQLSVLDSVQGGIENGGVHFCMCNPPFYDDSIAPHQRNCKTPNRPAASAAATGLPHELACSGGERHFVAQLVRHSVAYKQRCQIFSSLLGHKSSVRPLKRLMYECGAISVVSTEFCQGNTLRWGVAWTFCTNVDIQHVKTPGQQVRKRPPLQCIVPHNLGSLKYTVTAVKTLIISWLHELHMRVEEGGCNQYYASYKISATHDSWTHSRRRRRMMHHLASQLHCTDTPDESLLSSVNNQLSANFPLSSVDHESSPNFPLSPSSVNDGLSVDSPSSSAGGGSFTNSPSSSASPLSSSAMCVEAEETWTSAVPGKKRPDIQDDSTCESEDSVKRSCRFSSPENNISSRLAPASPLVFTLFVQCRGGGDIVLQMRFLSGNLGLHGLNGVMCHVTNRLRSHVAAASGHVTSVKNT